MTRLNNLDELIPQVVFTSNFLKIVFTIIIIIIIFRYDKKEEAQAALNNLNGVIPDGGTEAMQVKIAEEHGKQKAAYYAGWQAGFSHKGNNYHAHC